MPPLHMKLGFFFFFLLFSGWGKGLHDDDADMPHRVRLYSSFNLQYVQRERTRESQNATETETETETYSQTDRQTE